MVLALLTIIRPIQIPPVWSVQKAAAERMEARKRSLRSVPCKTDERTQPGGFI